MDNHKIKKTVQGHYLIAVGVGGGPVAQLGSRPVSSASSPHTSVGPTNRSSKVGLASGSSHPQLHPTQVESAQEPLHIKCADGTNKSIKGRVGKQEEELFGGQHESSTGLLEVTSC